MGVIYREEQSFSAGNLVFYRDAEIKKRKL